MRSFFLAALLAASAATAQIPERVERSSSPSGMKVQGDTTISAVGAAQNAVAIGAGNSAKNAAGAVKGNVQIEGATRINAVSQNANAVAIGAGNAASNTVGGIGGK